MTIVEPNLVVVIDFLHRQEFPLTVHRIDHARELLCDLRFGEEAWNHGGDDRPQSLQGRNIKIKGIELAELFVLYRN